MAIVKATKIWMGNQDPERLLPLQWKEDSPAIPSEMLFQCLQSVQKRAMLPTCLLVMQHRGTCTLHMGKEMTIVPYDFQQKPL